MSSYHVQAHRERTTILPTGQSSPSHRDGRITQLLLGACSQREPRCLEDTGGVSDSDGQAGGVRGVPDPCIITKWLPQTCTRGQACCPDAVISLETALPVRSVQVRGDAQRGGAMQEDTQRGERGLASSTHPHPTLPPQPHRPALPTAPLQHVQQVCPQAHCTLPSPHTACQRNATRQPWATSPHFLCTCWGLQLYRQVLLTPSQEFTQHSAAHHTHSSEGEKKLHIHSRKRSS